MCIPFCLFGRTGFSSPLAFTGMSVPIGFARAY
jgi:hypothetical protein